MELGNYLAILRKRWMIICVVVVTVLAATVAGSLLSTPTYQAYAQVYVSVRSAGTTSDLFQGSNFTQNQVASYKELVTSPRVLVPVIEQLDIASTPDVLATQLRADAPLNSVLINIYATDQDPQLAADIANAVSGSLATEVAAIERPEDGPSPVRISTVRTAAAPQTPSSPNLKLNVALAALVSLAAGVALAVIRDVLDTRVRGEADVKKVSSASVVATITHDDDASKNPLLTGDNPHSQRAESFRRLRTNLQFLDVTDDLQTMVVTSSLPGEGKSTTVINLAITLADAGTRVLLIDADLRRPSVATYMGIEGSAGLTTVLIGRASVQDVVQPWGHGHLHVLPSGQIPPNPSELLGSRSMADLLELMRVSYDVILIDTPPLLPVTDAAILARLTGGAIVVVGTHAIHQNELAQSLGALETVGANVLGLVLNRVPAKSAGSYTYYDYAPLDPNAKGRKSRRMSSTTASSAKAVEPRRRQPARSAARRAETPPRRTVPAPVPATERTMDDLFGEEPVHTKTDRWPGGPLGGAPQA